MSTVNRQQLNAVSSGGDVGAGAAFTPAMPSGALDASVLPATDIKFCAIDDPTCEACQ